MIVCGSEELIRRFMMAAQDKGMTKGDYVYITPSLLPVVNMEKRWVVGDDRDEEARRAFGSLLQVISLSRSHVVLNMDVLVLS